LILKSLVEKFQPLDQHLAELANLYSIRKEYAKSLAIYKRLLEKDSLNYYYAKQVGKNFLDMNQSDSAIYYYEYAFSLNQKDVFLAHRLGNLHLRNKDLPTAIMRVNTGLEHDSTNIDLLKLRGYLFIHFGRYDLAIMDLEKARLQDSLSAFTNKYLGMSYYEDKQFNQARITFMEAVIVEEGLVCLAPEIKYLVHQGISQLQGIGYPEQLFITAIQQQEFKGQQWFFRLA